MQLMDATLVCDTKAEAGDTAGEPLRFRVGQGSVIRGLDEALPKVVVGQTVRLIISPDFAYGSRGFYPTVPANSSLIVRLELLHVEAS
eukprot:CAMPEP_0174934558 /NCGR_PEP_ID=MMETSP1355-20121228/50018_1 /TAXON_ID=464990 /ORGANISM="Hemiselmis tepida, Strain CCMP443" /LENGTH=87 /DNA_ID=CAMNT_0016181173 /DNA_START=23 /DNA_END=286 /DNA_ORIENTATION=-